jgi:hypothetical protein
MSRVKVPMTFGAPRWDPQYDMSVEASRMYPRVPFVKLPDDMREWADVLLPQLARKD